MTKEELKQEAIEYVCKRNPLVIKGWFIDAFKKYDKGEKVKYLKDYEIAEYEAYLAGAEPREKQIKIDAKQIRALQKQNGELTDELKALRESIKDYGAGCYENGLRNGKRKLEEQLTKAKEIIREFVEWATWQGSNCPNFKSIQDKAEQFISEVEK